MTKFVADLAVRHRHGLSQFHVVTGATPDGAYEAVHSGAVPSIRAGRRLLVPVPKLLALLGAETAAKETS